MQRKGAVFAIVLAVVMLIMSAFFFQGHLWRHVLPEKYSGDYWFGVGHVVVALGLLGGGVYMYRKPMAQS